MKGRRHAGFKKRKREEATDMSNFMERKINFRMPFPLRVKGGVINPYTASLTPHPPPRLLGGINSPVDLADGEREITWGPVHGDSGYGNGGIRGPWLHPDWDGGTGRFTAAHNSERSRTHRRWRAQGRQGGPGMPGMPPQDEDIKMDGMYDQNARSWPWQAFARPGVDKPWLPGQPLAPILVLNPRETVHDMKAQQWVGPALLQVDEQRQSEVGQHGDLRVLVNGAHYGELAWRFTTINDAQAWALSYSCFEYALSDLWGGGMQSGTSLMLALIDILHDIKAIGTDNNGAPLIRDDNRIMVYFEGEQTEWEEDKDQNEHPDPIGRGTQRMLYCTDRQLNLGRAIEDPSVILEAIIKSFASSDHWADFHFWRVYVHVQTNLNAAGSLECMPEAYKKLRDGIHFKKMKKGYMAIDDSEDNSCGFVAIIWALSNSLARIKKRAKAIGAVPELCERFQGFRKKMKHNNKATKLLLAEVKGELATFIGWKVGNMVSPLELCEAFEAYVQRHKINAGLVIFDAIHPHTGIVASYNPKERVPNEKLCLIHWEYPGGEGGHYDCIDHVNITTWMQRGVDNRKSVRFSFRRLCLISVYESDEKGDFCSLCFNYQHSMHIMEWRGGHGGTRDRNKIECKDCGVRFKTLNCLKAHRIPVHGLAKSGCDKNFFCRKCIKVHDRKYKCDFFFCQICMKSIPKKDREEHKCFMRQTSAKSRKRIDLVISSDMETCQDEGQHRAICVTSHWTQYCPEHLKEFKEKKCVSCKLEPDEWGLFCSECSRESLERNDCIKCKEPKSTYIKGNDCLEQYIAWIFENFAGGLVIFHNGGKFDLHLLYIALLATGLYKVDKEAARSTQIIYMKASLYEDENKKKKRAIKFLDSVNFIPAPLRKFPSMFEMKGGLRKGRFPYSLLNSANWEDWIGECPGPAEFGITELELKNLDRLSINRAAEIKELLAYIKEFNESGESWVATDVLREYALDDVRVLHAGIESFRKNFWEILGVDPFHWVTLPAAVSGAYRQAEFMEEDSIQLFGVEDREWQREGLRGGRTEPFKLYWKKPADGKTRFKVFDVVSEYPFVQAYGYFPKGALTHDFKYVEPLHIVKFCIEFKEKTGYQFYNVLSDPTGKHGCGIIECEIESGNSFIPILPFKVKRGAYVKNLFMNRCGKWQGYLTVLAEAVSHCQVIITSVKRLQFWKRTTNKLCRKFITTLYSKKCEASGWDKILEKGATLAEKEKFLNDSKDMGIKIDTANIADNPGMRTTMKLTVVSAWGTLCQKPHADETFYYNNDDPSEMDSLSGMLDTMETNYNPRRIIGMPSRVGKFTRLRTTKDPLDITDKEMSKKVAYQIGGQVPAYGLQLLSKELIRLHPSQPAYCDTDSIFYIENEDMVTRGIHKQMKSGDQLGSFKDEYPDCEIVEFCCLGPKSYFLKIIHNKTGKEEYKGKFKGIPLTSASYSLLDEKNNIAKLGMEEMKDILFSAMEAKGEHSQTMTFHYTNNFKRGPDMKIKKVEEKKSVRFTFDKREIQNLEALSTLPPHLINDISTSPWADGKCIMTEEDIKEWWRALPSKIELEETLGDGARQRTRMLPSIKLKDSSYTWGDLIQEEIESSTDKKERAESSSDSESESD